MKKMLFISLLFFASLLVADHSVDIKEGNIALVLPDTWTQNKTQTQNTPPKMNANDPLFLSWKREGLAGKNGRVVNAGLNVVVFDIQKDANVVIVSHSLMTRRGWPFKEFLTAEKDGLKLSNSMGYYTEQKPQSNVVLKLFVIHAINDGKFVEIVLSATEDIFPSVESELREIIKTVHLRQK